MPFDFKRSILDLPFRPLTSNPPAIQTGTGNPICDPSVIVLTAGYRRGTVVPITPCTGAVGAGIPTGQGSLEIAITPDGKSAFVTNYNGSVVVIDTAKLSIVTTIPTPGASPYGIAISPDGSTVYVASFKGNLPALIVIDAAKRVVTDTVPLDVVPQNVFISPDGALLWITSQLANNVTILDTLTLKPSATIDTIQWPTGIGFNPTGTVAYIASATIPGTVTAVNTTDYSTVRTYTVGNEPVDVRVSDPATVTVMNRSSDFVSRINVLTGEVTSDAVNQVTNVQHTGFSFIQ